MPDSETSHREQIAGNVRAEVARHRVPQEAIARALDLPQQAVSRRLHGKTPFRVDELAAIAELLGVSVTDLIGATATEASA